jgi:hypothetical protein
MNSINKAFRSLIILLSLLNERYVLAWMVVDIKNTCYLHLLNFEKRTVSTMFQ